MFCLVRQRGSCSCNYDEVFHCRLACCISDAGLYCLSCDEDDDDDDDDDAVSRCLDV